jgi:TPP-dependent pyruvate/acetoin dehydrogenase alpha subunit
MNLDVLANPTNCRDALNIDGQDATPLRAYLRILHLIRKAEQALAEKRRQGLIGGPVHLGVGQEAIAVGVSESLRASDRIFGAHRSHSHLLAMGSSLHGLFAEVLGKKTGLSGGMGGSMHLWDQRRGFYGSVPIVAGTVSLAVGAAMAATMQDTGDVGVAYFGDGAMEEGVVHESLNLARLTKAPVLFVCENNLFASHMHISLRQPEVSVARFAVANDIPFRLVDGNDVVAVAKAANELVTAARQGLGPGFLEAVTFRWYGHVDWREDIDVGVCRSVDELASWRARDPIRRLREAMIAKGLWSEGQEMDLNAELDDQVSRAWDQAMRDPYPDAAAVLEHVYA